MYFQKLFLIITLSTYCMLAPAQKIWEGDLYAAQLVKFFKEDFTEVTGNVEIKKTDLRDLAHLSKLTKVGGNLTIFENSSLTSIAGLELLNTVSGKVSIRQNKQLFNYCALNKKLLLNGITGEKLSENIYEKFDTQDNEYNPDLMDLIDGECEYYNPLYHFVY